MKAGMPMAKRETSQISMVPDSPTSFMHAVSPPISTDWLITGLAKSTSPRASQT